MGSNTLPTRANTQVINDSWFNLIKQALTGDQFARDADGVVGDLEGSLGSESVRFLKAHIASGGFSLGDIKPHHSYDGAAPIGQGWMLCDGRVINEANYDTEHGAGSWDAYVIASALDGKYLPNLTSRYLIGKATTPQDGSDAITAVGNANNQLGTDHLHTMGDHKHAWYKVVSGGDDKLYQGTVPLGDGDGDESVLTIGTAKTGKHLVISTSNTDNALGANTNDAGLIWTGSMDNGATNAETSTDGGTKDIRPDSIEVQYYMRVIA